MLKIESNYCLCSIKEADKLISFVNPYSWILLKDYSAAESFLFFADGILVVKLHNLLYKRKIHRFSFDDTSIAPNIFEEINKHRLRVGLVGGKPGVALRAKQLLEAKYPGLQVIQAHAGYFNSEDEKKAVQRDLLSLDVVIAGMGTPLQENFLLELKAQFQWKGVGFTCGGYLDQFVKSEGKPYYPVIIDQLQLRALYRFYSEPRRLFKRYFCYYPMFVILFILQKLRGR